MSNLNVEKTEFLTVVPTRMNGRLQENRGAKLTFQKIAELELLDERIRHDRREIVFGESVTHNIRSRDFVGERIVRAVGEKIRVENENGGGAHILVDADRLIGGFCAEFGAKREQVFSKVFLNDKIEIYCGLGTYFIPKVYEAVIESIRKNTRARQAAQRFWDVLNRLEMISKYAYRYFSQMKVLPAGHRGSRRVAINKEEYRELLNMEYARSGAKSRSQCAICTKRYDAQNKSDITVHHIVGKGSLRHIRQMYENKQFFTKEELTRAVGSFGQNEIYVCRECHDGVENALNYHLIMENPQSNIGYLYVADLHIILARKIAHYAIFGGRKREIELYYDTMNFEAGLMARTYCEYGVK